MSVWIDGRAHRLAAEDWVNLPLWSCLPWVIFSLTSLQPCRDPCRELISHLGNGRRLASAAEQQPPWPQYAALKKLSADPGKRGCSDNGEYSDVAPGGLLGATRWTVQVSFFPFVSPSVFYSSLPICLFLYGSCSSFFFLSLSLWSPLSPGSDAHCSLAIRDAQCQGLFLEAPDLLNFLFSGDAISEERNETTAKHNKNTIQPAASAELDISVYVIRTALLCNWLAFLRILQGNGKTDQNTKRK